jgi:hypothetical protein
MSILNHFGKVKTTFIPYTNKHKFYDGVKTQVKIRRGQPFEISAPLIWLDRHQTHGTALLDEYIGENDNLSIQYNYNDVHEDFKKVIERMITHFTSSIWKTLNISPFMTLTQLICLKVDDVEGRVEHLENMLKKVIDDNKLLQRKIDMLEKRPVIAKAHPVDSVGKTLLYEMD